MVQMKIIKDWVITDAQLTKWISSFLLEQEPFFLNDPQLVTLLHEHSMMVYSRREYIDSHPNFVLQSASVYNLWEQSKECWVWASSSNLRAQLPQDLLERIFQEQARLNRGQVHDAEWMSWLERECSLSDASKRLLDSHVFQTSGTRHMIMTYEIWQTLPREVREHTLLRWLASRLEQEPRSRDLDEIPAIHPASLPLLRSYAGRFSDSSGANCFAAALAFCMENHVQAGEVIRLWLHQGPFFRMLDSIGYILCMQVQDESGLDSIEPSDVLVWRNHAGEGIHAAYCIAAGFVFNKMGQSWEQPWSVIDIKDILDYSEAISGGGKIVIYRKNKP